MEIGTRRREGEPADTAIEDVPPADEFLGRFDALAAGESLSLGTDRDPGPYLAILQASRRGLFEWSPDLAGPRFWRTKVTRRAVAPGGDRTISDALAWDHDRLDALEGEAFAARDRGDFDTASETFDAFARGLDRHISFEESLLFPVFEEATGHPADAGPTAVMREEHRMIRSLLAEIAAAMRDPAASPAGRRLSLTGLLAEHNEKEEQILYPMTDAALGREGADGLVREIQAFRTG